MKTSTKLLIVLFACLPLSMLVYGYLLKQQFNAGNFYQDIYSNKEKYVFKKLTPFKHVVIDGDLYVRYESALTVSKAETENQLSKEQVSVKWGKVFGFDGLRKEAGYRVLTGFEDIVKTKVKNDTLYISFFKRNGERLTYAHNGYIFSISNGTLSSLDVTSGLCYLSNVTDENLVLKVKNAGLKVNKVDVKTLSVFAENANSINIDSSRISLLQYSLLNHSKLNLENNAIKNFQKLSLDSLSKISIEGYATSMERSLQLLLQPKK